MAAPSMVSANESSFNTGGASGTTKSVTLSIEAGDLILVRCHGADGAATFGTPTNDGTALAWTQIATIGAASTSSRQTLFAATGDATRTLVVTVARTGETNFFGLAGKVWRSSDGRGTPVTGSIVTGSGAPSVNLTTTQANSAIDEGVTDWNAADGTTRTWRNGAGAVTERTYFRDAAQYAVYDGYHADAGAIGTYALGLSAPATMRWSLIGVEVKGTAGGAAAVLPPRRGRVILPRTSPPAGARFR